MYPVFEVKSIAPPKVDDVVNALKKNKAAADILAGFEKVGGTVISGDTNTGAKIVGGEKPTIVLDPVKIKNEPDAVGLLLYELVRWKNFSQQQDIFDKVKAGTMSPKDGAVASEKLTYNYMVEVQNLLEAAAKAGDWDAVTTKFKNTIDKFKNFDDFLKVMTSTGHLGRMEEQLKQMAPK